MWTDAKEERMAAAATIGAEGAKGTRTRGRHGDATMKLAVAVA